MFLDQLAPKNDVKKFIPDYLYDEKTNPGVLPFVLEDMKRKYGTRDYVGFVSGLAGFLESINSPSENDVSTWFKTDEVVDVRVFFRASSNSDRGTLGSKVRLYSMGKPYRSKGKGSDKLEVQALDTGFMTYNFSDPSGTMVFQSALASTMLYASLYCIGGKASVRKINTKTDDDIKDNEAGYKWLSAIRPAYSPDFDRKDINHILYPAAVKAGVDNPVEFFGANVLDALLDILVEAKSMDDFDDMVFNAPELEFLEEADIDDIISKSNDKNANLANQDDQPDGINVVSMMTVIADALRSQK